MKKIFIIILTCIFLASLASADVYVGTSEGNIYNTEGELVASAYVKATVDQCMVNCFKETTSGSNGYYVVNNLNLPKQETLTVYAEKQNSLYGALEFGQATGIANDYQAAEIDVVICLPPPAPVLVNEPNTHNTFATLEWTSYADLKSYATYDQFRLNANPIITNNNPGTKSQDVINLAFANHNWRVRTCNPYCCSQWVSDPFTVGNSAPSAPILTDQLDTTPGIINQEWVSGIDPDGDETYDEHCFNLVDDPLTCEEAISPQEKTTLGCNYYSWQVRTCERESQQLCSSWSQDGFSACGLECPTCSTPSCGGGGGGCDSEQPYSLSIVSPPEVEQGKDLVLDIGFFTSRTVKNILFEVSGYYFTFEKFMINEMSNFKKSEFELTGKPFGILEPGIYNLTVDVFIANKKTFSETLNVKIVKSPSLYIGIKKQIQAIPPKNRWWVILIIILALCALAFATYKIIKKQQQKNQPQLKQKKNQ